MEKKLKLQRWGNSLGIRISASIANELGWQDGSGLIAETKENYLVIRKDDPNLNDLLDEIQSDNLHLEIETGTPKGREIW